MGQMFGRLMNHLRFLLLSQLCPQLLRKIMSILRRSPTANGKNQAVRLTGIQNESVLRLAASRAQRSEKGGSQSCLTAGTAPTVRSSTSRHLSFP